MKKKTNILLILFAISTSMMAENLTLDSCMSLAIKNNATLLSADLDIQKAKEVKAQAFTKYFPQVSATAMGYHSLRPMFEYGINNIENAGTRDLLNTLYGNYGAALGLENTISLFQHGIVAGVTAIQPVYMGGQIVNGNRLAKLGIEAAELQKNIAARDLLEQVEESYWLVYTLQEKQKTLDSATNLIDTLLHTVEQAVNAGLAINNDLLKVKIKQNELSAKQLQLQNGIMLAKRALCQSIGIDYTDSIVLTDTLGVSAENLSANNERAEKRLLELQVEAAELQKKMEVGKALPQIAIGGGYAYSNMLDKNTTNGTLFFTVQVPLTNWWETSHKLKEMDLNLQKAQLQQQDLNEKMQLQEEQTKNTMEEARQQLLLNETSLKMAEENFRLAQANYSSGMLTLSELLEAQTFYLQSQNEHTDLLISYKIATHRYQDLCGNK